jgi:hypothetical protein
VHLNLFFNRDSLRQQELVDVASLVALQLNNCAPLFVLDNGAVAAPCLLELAQNFLEVQIVRQSLDEGKALARGALLEMEVYWRVNFRLGTYEQSSTPSWP